MNNLEEAFQVKGGEMGGKKIAYVDSDSGDTFKFKDIFKKHGARWNNKFKVWFWFLGDTEDKWRNTYDRMIKPALEAAHQAEGASEESSKEAIIAGIDQIIGSIDKAPTSQEAEAGMSGEQKNELKGRLDKFKQVLVNIDSDEEFKSTMRTIIAMKNARGHQYSLYNTLLIYLQNPKATRVASKYRWQKNFNRTVNKDAKPIFVYSPAKSAMGKYSKQEKDSITKKFLSATGKKSVGELSAGEKDRLDVTLRGKFYGGAFDFTPAFDVSDTTPIEGMPDPVGDAQAAQKDVKWFEENVLSDEVKPVYNALMEFAKSKGISVNLVDDLGGARGVSKSGSIDLLRSEGNDVGITKTLAHEITHELLHQKYLKGKDDDTKKFFIGTEQGRDAVEQQAELTAWMVMGSYGFDLQTTSLNYVALWGGDKDKMVKVFDQVVSVANYLIDEINKRLPANESINEDAPIRKASHIDPYDVARALGVTQDYRDQLKIDSQKNEMVENFFRVVNLR
jgi:hypothetical protein